MFDRTQEITQQFETWLDGYMPPRSMADNPDRLQAEKISLLRIVLRFCPADDYRDFLANALDECAMLMKTRAWPTQNELGAALRNYRKENPKSGGISGNDAWKADSAEITAAKMRNGDAVGEGWLYGIAACEMIARKLIDQDTMTRYRSAAFFARKVFYGEAEAIAWETKARADHENAKDVWRARNDKRDSMGNLALADMVKYPGADAVFF